MIDMRLGHVHHLAVFLRLAGDIRVLHIHKVTLVEAAHAAERLGAHHKKTARAELDLLRAGQILVLHQIMPFHALQKRQRNLPGQQRQKAGPPLCRILLGPVREQQARRRHHHIRVSVHPRAQL